MLKSLYFWVVVFIFFGLGLGVWAPDLAIQLKPMGDRFVSGIKIFVIPLVFLTVALGISGAQSKGRAAKVGFTALVYFELVSTSALLIGLLVGNFAKPGLGFPFDSSKLDASLISDYVHPVGSVFNPFQVGINLIQALLLGIGSGVLLHFVSEKRRLRIRGAFQTAADFVFSLISKYMWLAPLGAFAAIAFTVGKFGLGSLKPLMFFMGCFYLTCALFVLGVLGLIARVTGFSMFRFLSYIKSEILLVLGTSSSESALAPLMRKLEKLGCREDVVGLVVPTGYSFNLDGTNIYLTLSVLFIAQAFQIDLPISSQLSILAVAMLSSKGASGVTGAGFITLAATLSVAPEVPLTGLILILGIDRFMSEARAITNMIGNGVATLVIAKWEGALSESTLREELG